MQWWLWVLRQTFPAVQPHTVPLFWVAQFGVRVRTTSRYETGKFRVPGRLSCGQGSGSQSSTAAHHSYWAVNRE